MALIHINRAGTSLGTFSEEDVRQGLRGRRFSGTDLGWREGMPAWQPLSEFTEFAADLAAGAAAPPVSTPPPGVAPPPGSVPMGVPVGALPSTDLTRPGLPWDQRQTRGWFNAFIETLQMVLTRPTEAFSAMRTEGGLGEPLIYALIGGCAGAIVSFLFSLGFQSLGLFADRHSGIAALAGFGIGSVAFIILVPMFLVIGLFLVAAIIHLCLMIVGGAKKSFETTFRVIAFSQGSTGPLQMIPLCGSVVAGVWSLILNCIGLARAHEIETGRAVLAVFLPVLVCCGGGILLIGMLGGLGALNQNWH